MNVTRVNVRCAKGSVGDGIPLLAECHCGLTLGSVQFLWSGHNLVGDGLQCCFSAHLVNVLPDGRQTGNNPRVGFARGRSWPITGFR